MTDRTESTLPVLAPSERKRPRRPALAERVDARMLALMRCVLAFSAFLAIGIDASEPSHWMELTRVSLGLYCVYSMILALASAASGWPQPHRALHWVDTLLYVYLVVLTGGASSLFFSFFLFSILVASFTRGFREGLLVSVLSLSAFSAVAVAVAAGDPDFELNRTLLRAVYLFVFGYMISYWGGYETLLKLRLALLNEINNAWSPRFGVDHAVGSNLDRLLDFYQADACVLMLRRPGAQQDVMYRRLRGKPEASELPLPMTERASEPMLRLPPALGAFFHSRESSLLHRWRGYTAIDVVSKLRIRDYFPQCEALSNLLDAPAFVTVPFLQRDGTVGRLFLSGRRGFDQSDIHFLTQAGAAIATVIENITLMDELISRASEVEREKISRDLHDSTVQPYIGLKLALDALLREAAAGAGADNHVSARLSELVDMAGMTIRDLRDIAAVTGKSTMPGSCLLDAIRRKIDRLSRFYGIDVNLDTVLSEKLDGRVAADVFHIVSEGLSNILRHTSARAAYVHIVCEGGLLTVDIGNEAQALPPAFTPRSMRDRAEALGGSTVVERDAAGYTVVRIVIPL
jgi:signal transduction histidine kinase